MNDDPWSEDPLESSRLDIPLPDPGLPAADASASADAAAILSGQDAFLKLVGKFHELYWALPEITTRGVDERLAAMYGDLMELAPRLGVSPFSIPSLRECCGKKRVWQDSPTGEKVARYLRLGDAVRWVTKLFGVKPCDACERRRLFLNRLIKW